MPRQLKKSKYKSVVIKRNDITFTKLPGSISRVIPGMQIYMNLWFDAHLVMITHAYLFEKDKKNVIERLHLTKKMMNYLVIEMYFQEDV